MALFGSADTPVRTVNLNLTNSPFSLTVLRAVEHNEDRTIFVIDVSVTNNTAEVIDAFMISFELFTVFNEYMGHYSGYHKKDIKPGKSQSSSYHFHIYNSALVGGVIAYTHKVRLKSGAVWMGNPEEIERNVETLYHLQIDVLEEEKKGIERVQKK